MSTDLYGVRVLAVSGSTLELDVLVVCDDALGLPNPALPGFFLMVAREAGVPISATIDELMSPAWVHLNAGKWLRSVSLAEVANVPGGLAKSFHYHRDGGWADEAALPRGRYRIEVSDPGLLSGVRVGKSWGTTAFEVGPYREGTFRTDDEVASLADTAFNSGLNLEPVSDAFVTSVVECLTHSSDSLVFRVLEALGRIVPGPRAAIPAICQHLDHGGPDVVAFAFEALARIGEPWAAGPIVAVLSRSTRGLPHAPGDARAANPDALVALARIGPSCPWALDVVKRLHPVSSGFARIAGELALYRMTRDPVHFQRWSEAMKSTDSELAFRTKHSMIALGEELPVRLGELAWALDDEMLLDHVLPVLHQLGKAAAPAREALLGVLAGYRAHYASNPSEDGDWYIGSIEMALAAITPDSKG